MKITKDFEHDKEVQKKKKMAVLKNEEYKETDEENISDSDENILFETNEEEEKLKPKKNESIIIENLDKEYENIKILDINNNIEIENEYFKPNESQLNTQSNFNQSKIECDFKDKNNKFEQKLDNSYYSKVSKENLEKNKIIKKQIIFAESELDIIKIKQGDDKKVNNENSKSNPHKRNNLASGRDTKDLKKGSIRKDSKFFNCNSNNNNNNSKIKNINILRKTSTIKNDPPENDNKNEEKSIQEELQENNIESALTKKKMTFIKNLPCEKLQDLINMKKKKLEGKICEEIKQRSELKADLLLDISLDDYTGIDKEENDGATLSNVNVNNLNRIIRVRNILKGRHKDDKEKRDYMDLHKDTDEELLKIMRFQKLGPPSFLKTNFKKETNLKFKMLGGKFFGCQV